MIQSIVFFLISYIFLFTAIYFSRRLNKNILLSVMLFLSVLLISVLSILHYLTSIFYGSSDYDAILFHIEYGLQGANIFDYPIDIGVCISILLSNLLIIFYIFSKKSTINVHKNRSFHKSHIFLGYISLLLFVLFNPSFKSFTQYLTTSIKPTKTNSNSFQQEYQTKVSSNPNKPLNFIYIYLESFERIYFDNNLYPDLLPGLSKIEDNSVSFTNLTQTTGAGWTIAGMVASQCGIPLFAASGPNGTKNYDKFLPDAVCVGDILKKNRYNLSFLGGSALSFTGKGNFYNDHGFAKVIGKQSLKSKYHDKHDYSRWGLNDDKLLDEAYHEYITLSKKPNPFGIFLITLGTHNPGYLSQSCSKNIFYGDEEDKLLNAVKCTDKIVSDFVYKIRTSEHSSNTMIVIASDHLSMGKRHQGKQRRNLFLVNFPKLEPNKVNKRGSTLDIAPTLLNLLGFSDVKKFGFGINLLQDNPTLIQKHNNPNKYLTSWKDDIIALWSPPKFEGELNISTISREVVLGERVLKIPVILTFSATLETDRVIYESSTPKITHYDFISNFSPETDFMYIDSCDKTSILNENSKFKRSDRLCLSLGSLRSNISEFEIHESDTYTVNKLKKILVHNRMSNSDQVKNRVNRLTASFNF